MGLFGDLLDLIGLGGITGIDILFAVMAIIGTVLFLIYFLLVMVFGFADDMLPFDMEMSADGIFHLFTIQGILSFMMMFGIFGLAMTQADQHSLIAIIVGVIAGSVSMYIVGKIFQMMKGLEMDNTIKYSEAIGAKGTVYRTINAGEHGQVQVEYQGALRTSDAVAKDEKLTIQTGKFIKVVDAIGETLIIEPLDISTHSEEQIRQFLICRGGSSLIKQFYIL